LAPCGQAVSEEKIFLTFANQKKELILAAMFVGRMEPNEAFLKLLSFLHQILKMLILFILYFKNYKR
jgi:hypothetical protein